MFVTAKDIADRILRRKPYWFDGPPHIELRHESQYFNMLRIIFSDEVLEYQIYKTKIDVLSLAREAVNNIGEYL